MRVGALAVLALVVVDVVACKDAARQDDSHPPSPSATAATPAPTPGVTDARGVDDAPPGDADAFADLGAALHAIVPADARAIGFGELHARTDRAQVRTALQRFTTEALPTLTDRLSDLVVETWIVDPKCGHAAQEATAKIITTMRRPAETKSQIGALADAARAAGIQPHAMTLTCSDYTRVAPVGKDVDVEAMLTLTTRELGRIAREAIAHRDAESTHRPLVAIYGGMLHTARFPEAGVEDWSYAKQLDAATHDHFVEIDLIVPELALADPSSQRQPWFPLVQRADDRVHTFARGERSFVLILPRSKDAP
jgi:hypothetical protein